MLPCYECKHKKLIPGNAHIRCDFAWKDKQTGEIPVGDTHGVMMGWFFFPFNFDPVWGPEECVGFNKER
jgi:hypothetical protein